MLKSWLVNVNLLENIYQISIAFLLLCSIFSVRLIKKLKLERKLSFFENIMNIIIRIAIFLWLASFLLIEYGGY
ncbi:hypothetical protein [Lysinibacillus xylanilyticus]|uniref:Uncharacterized protein n=1 Tax=Lysinibacillus xylanilyticus TaxID=582475 RepID=A0A2M9Q6N7_9BACI|nr:hypothetical protein [Lysinibacillus xylanilyticus]PJO43751.1 hypothetical protein CWD94_10495 [Lysinibacillus xylanilyticus]